MQWAQAGAQEVPSKHREALLCCEADGPLAQIAAERLWGLCLCIFRSCLGMVLDTALLEQGLEQTDPVGPDELNPIVKIDEIHF